MTSSFASLIPMLNLTTSNPGVNFRIIRVSKCWGRRVVAILRFTSLTFPFQSRFLIFLGDSPCVCAMFDDSAWAHDINHLRILGCSLTQITTMALAPVKNLQIPVVPVALADGDRGFSCDEVGKGWAQPCCDLRNFGMECVHSHRFITVVITGYKWDYTIYKWSYKYL